MTPTVSVGLPVFNGASYLTSALDSLLSQSYGNFELVISDNGSTDETAGICRAYANRDSRIRYFRHETNRGAYWNFDFVLKSATGQYFMWAAYDDMWEPTLIERLLDLHRRSPLNTVLTSCEVGNIGVQGEELPTRSRLHRLQPTVHDTDSAWSLAMFIKLGTEDRPENLIHGLIRMEVARSADVMRRWQTFGATSDYFMVANLLRFGNVAVHQEILWKKRIHAGSETSKAAALEVRNARPSLRGVGRTFAYGVRFTLAVWRVLGPVQGAAKFPPGLRLSLTTLVAWRCSVHFLVCCLAAVRRRVSALALGTPA